MDSVILKADVLAAIRQRANLTELEHEGMVHVVDNMFGGAETMDLDRAKCIVNTALATVLGFSEAIATALEAGGTDG